MCMISLLWEFGVFSKNKYNREATKYYFNPEKFKIYENGSIGFGGFIIYMLLDMYVLKYAYINEIIRSSHLPWNLDDFLGDTIRKHYLDHNVISLTPYDGIQIVVNDKHGQLIQVNEFTIKADYPSNYRDLKHKLLLKEKVIKESASLKELWEIATNV